jgi:hypothetical protein
MNVTFRALMTLLAFPLVSCGSPLYIADPIEAWVVDAETNKPIEGAVVVANWQLVKGGLDGPRQLGQLEVKEAVTDKAGRFFFEGFRKVNPTLGELRDADPRILIFKVGYEYKTVSNNYPAAGTRTPGMQRTSPVNGKTVRLKGTGPLRMGAGDVFYPFLSIDLENVMKDCGWKKIPQTLLAMDRAHQEIKVSHPQATTGLVTIEFLEATASECGSASAFLKAPK